MPDYPGPLVGGRPQGFAPLSSRSHMPPAQRDTFGRLGKYFDPESEEGFPLTRLGVMANGDNLLDRWKSPVNLLGMNLTGDATAGMARDPLFARIMEETGLDPVNSAGEIAVGPQFDQTVNWTLEHEMMHKAINTYFPQLVGGDTEEVLIRQILDPQGTPENRLWVEKTLGRDWDELYQGLASARAVVERKAKEQLEEVRKGIKP